MSWSRLVFVADSGTAAISLADAKAHLRVDHTADDAYIESLVAAATDTIEGPHGIGVALLTQVWRLDLDYSLPSTIMIPLGPVQSVQSVTYTDNEGDLQTLDAASYAVVPGSPGFVQRLPNAVWPVPAHRPKAASVNFTAGYGVPADIPAGLRHAMLLMIGHLYRQREAVVVGTIAAELPLGFNALVERYRVGRFG